MLLFLAVQCLPHFNVVPLLAGKCTIEIASIGIASIGIVSIGNCLD